MSGSREPDVSIVITSYNYARYLPRAIASALAQEIDHLEIVIVDNASTDESWSIIEAAASQNAVIRPFRNNENIGLVGNHQRGLELAKGKRVLFLSADDYLLPNHVRRVLAFHEEHPSVDAVFASYYQVDENDNVLRHLGHPGFLRSSYAGGRNEFAGLLTFDCYTCLPTTLFDREDLIASGGFDPEINAFDYELYIRLARLGRRFGFLNTPGVCIRVHSASASGQDRYVASGKQLLEHLHVLERHCVPETASHLRGHENGVANMLNAKLGNLNGYPEVAKAILPDARPRIDAIMAQIAAFVQRTSSQAISGTPLVSVIAPVEDVQSTLHLLTTLQRQNYAHVEVIALVRSPENLIPLLQDRAISVRVKALRGETPMPFGAQMNDALRLCEGELVTYLPANVQWPDNHLSRIAGDFARAQIDALVTPVDLIMQRNGVDASCFSGFAGAHLIESARVGESIPLHSLTYRRTVPDRIGGFEENLPHLVDFDFVQRLFGCGSIGVDDAMPVVERRPTTYRHPATVDPNGYVSSLRAIYAGRPAERYNAQREHHFNAVVAALNTLAKNADVSACLRFAHLARGRTPQPNGSRVRPRVLVIDDLVPYNELGRGYPRARAVIADLVAGGADVIFYPLVQPFDAPPLAYGLPGAQILYGRGQEMLAATLYDLLPEIDTLWVSRPHNMIDVRRAIGGVFPDDRSYNVVYDAEALYIERDRVRALLGGLPLEADAYERALQRELALTDGCDVVTAVSNAERRLIAQRFPGPIEILSFSIEADPTPSPFSQRDGLLFVGAIDASGPNEDALRWFLENVADHVEMPVRHAGVMTSPALAGNIRTEFLGLVPDLRAVYDRARVFIAPTRFAAGLPQKAYEAAAAGVPIVATPLLAAQMDWKHEDELLVANSANEWIEATTRLYRDEQLWAHIRERALHRVRSEVSPEAFKAVVARILTNSASKQQLPNIR